ncbi:hypothetical protein niasHT_017633 [Heterodera trifolii]|uniref:Paraneoplastic antigen Ma-like C-terminal domain-containing protein n=1 Tax=Heterodera trifolii TaxID=157864 RepID=A0ABD2L864_9BILA
MADPLENSPYEDIVAIDRRLFSGRNPAVQAKVSDLENVLSQVSSFEDASNRNLRYLNRRINATNEAIFKLSEELNTGLATMATRIDSLTDSNPFSFPFPNLKQNKQNRSKSQTPSRQFPPNVDLNAQSSSSITPNLAQIPEIRNRGLTDSSTPPPLNQAVIEEQQQDESHVWADESSDRINGLTFENQSSGGLNSFTGESSQTFESWSRKFMDYIEATGRRMEEGDKIGRLKMMLEGTPRDIFEDLPADRKATLQAAIHALKTVLDTPFKSQLAKQSLASCRQKEGEMVETFVERLIPLVNAAYQELDPKFRKDMLKSAFLEKLRDEISFHVRLGSSASQTFEETRIKALEVENLLATRKPRVDPDWINVMASSSSAQSPPNLLQGNFTTWQTPPPNQKRVSFVVEGINLNKEAHGRTNSPFIMIKGVHGEISNPFIMTIGIGTATQTQTHLMVEDDKLTP